MALKLDTSVSSGLVGLRLEAAASALSREISLSGKYWKLHMKELQEAFIPFVKRRVLCLSPQSSYEYMLLMTELLGREYFPK